MMFLYWSKMCEQPYWLSFPSYMCIYHNCRVCSPVTCEKINSTCPRQVWCTCNNPSLLQVHTYEHVYPLAYLIWSHIKHRTFERQGPFSHAEPVIIISYTYMCTKYTCTFRYTLWRFLFITLSHCTHACTNHRQWIAISLHDWPHPTAKWAWQKGEETRKCREVQEKRTSDQYDYQSEHPVHWPP